LTTLQGVAPSTLLMQSNWFFKDSVPAVNQPPPTSPSGLFTLPATGTGIDTVYTTAATYTAPSGTENVVLGGVSAQNITGNELNNIITSNNYASTINAGAGNDIIAAGRNLDVLTGGAGRDIFQFDNLPWAQSRIPDFTPGTDMLDLRVLFAASNYQGTNPIADGYVSLQSDGAGGTKFTFDPDGFASESPWQFYVAQLEHVSPTSLRMGVDWFFQ
jgi:hypothetical protein